MEYYVGFIAGMLACFAICLGIIKYNEIKQEKEQEKKVSRPDDTPLRFTAMNISPVPITAEIIVPREEMLVLPQEVIEAKLSRKLGEEVAKYAAVTTEENPMSFTTRIRARVAVVKDWGGFR